MNIKRMTDENKTLAYHKIKSHNAMQGGAGFTHWGYFKEGIDLAENILIPQMEQLQKENEAFRKEKSEVFTDDEMYKASFYWQDPLIPEERKRELFSIWLTQFKQARGK